MFADIIIDISVKSLDKTFQYIVPECFRNEVKTGSLVTVPFGSGNRQLKGYVVNLTDTPKFNPAKTKSITGVEKNAIPVESHLLALAGWIKENYGASMNDAIKAVMPVKKEVKEQVKRTVYPLVSHGEMEKLAAEFEKKHNTARARVARYFTSLDSSIYYNGIDYNYITKNLKCPKSVIDSLDQMGITSTSSARQYRNTAKHEAHVSNRHVLNDEQQYIASTVLSDYADGIRKTYLIHGVTGSGKTEVYMEIIEGVLSYGRQAIVLIPEIALTFQTVNRFYQRFGERVSVIHSRLSAGERYDQFLRAKEGLIDIMIGPRSALFTPFKRLGLIVVDEEHETSYQSETPPKYHAREVAVQRAGMAGASVLLGSATPSLEAYYKTQTGEYGLFTLKKRAGSARLPQVHIVDLREEFANKNYSVFSSRLSRLIEERLQRHEQSIIFINRRGYAGFISCRKCGEAIGCPHCSVSLKPHMHNGVVDRMKCHFCGYEIPLPAACPSCGSKYIGTFGIGTQQVEEAARKYFPGARILRMDADTTGGKDGHSRILGQFGRGEADILIGTQMIVKGHDFPNVTLVGIIAADLSLNAGDYRAAERTYQLVAQAAGRAGRGGKSGEVVLQTYQPCHYSIVHAANQDYESFYNHEISIREMLHYPPVSNILGVLVFSENEKSALKLAGIISEIAEQYQTVTVLGPADAPVAKAKDIYRKIVYGKCMDYSTLCSVKDYIEAFKEQDTEFRDCGINFEFNINR
ncbi:MAG: primosomal protein N' [Lachnospiraceae bacterium]|nr:primosomal protein N' [Lachnospiraceae bacterium]